MDRYEYQGSDEDFESFKSFGYGDFQPTRGGRFIVPKLLSGSDYSGGSVTVSNHRVFLERYGSNPGVFELTGGYFTYAVAIRVSDMTDEMRADLEALEDYPLLDEDDLSAVEMEAEDEAWKSWLASDFRKGLEAAGKLEEDSEISDEQLFERFRAACDASNSYFENEQGNSAWIDVERVVAAA